MAMCIRCDNTNVLRVRVDVLCKCPGVISRIICSHRLVKKKKQTCFRLAIKAHCVSCSYLGFAIFHFAT